MIIKHNPKDLFPPYRNYSHAIEVRDNSRLLIISGLNGYLSDGQTMPESFEEQGELIWQHIGTILRSAEMDYQDVISIRTYLSDPSFDEANVRLRMKYMKTHQPASTVICCTLLETKWKLEVEVMAAK
ncbi:MAG TPA: RidA family protein [Chitinophaga sp.]|uniref:RidA family protein n=1 Tax=Chitinophaga sp. TaxID=1869181 RepID=UPI002B896350|nr:RidA family protein [Chitinophaga sp.]HVI45864.1 RidA family protein [Chitinophaga sp.]